MKRIALLLASTVVAGPAFAADVVYNEPPAPAPVEVAAPIANWTGFYVGGQAGVAFGGSNSGFSGSTDPEVGAGTFSAFGSDQSAGFIGGVHVGYDYQLSNNIVIGALAEVMSKTLQLGLSSTGAPPIVTALLVATISAGPEILTALRAALANRMQSVVNIALGASLSTVILTVPVMEAMALYTGQPFQMAMTPVQTVMVAITLIVAAINLNDGQTNAIEGMTHFVLFATFLMLSVMGL